MTPTIPPPPDTEEIPPTDPAPPGPRAALPSLAPWPEEAVTAVECPHPHQLPPRAP